jgi:hypothetical protein
MTFADKQAYAAPMQAYYWPLGVKAMAWLWRMKWRDLKTQTRRNVGIAGVMTISLKTL